MTMLGLASNYIFFSTTTTTTTHLTLPLLSALFLMVRTCIMQPPSYQPTAYVLMLYFPGGEYEFHPNFKEIGPPSEGNG